MLRTLIGAWLRNAAQHKIQETVVNAAREQTAHGEGPAAEEPPCQVGLVFARTIESGGLEDLLTDTVTLQGRGVVAKRGQLHGRSVVLIRCGVGGEAADRGTRALIQAFHPQWVIAAGFASGLRAELKRNDILMVDHLADTRERRLAIDLRVDPAALAQTPHVHVGRLLTTEQPARSSQEKQKLAARHDALATDTESLAVAEACRDRQTRCMVVRVISDGLDEELPHDVEQLLEGARHDPIARRAGSMLGALWRRPGTVKDLYQLKENAWIASDRLAKFLAGIIRQLPEQG